MAHLENLREKKSAVNLLLTFPVTPVYPRSDHTTPHVFHKDPTSNTTGSMLPRTPEAKYLEGG